MNKERRATVATITAVLPRVSKVVQEQVVARVPRTGTRRPKRLAHRNRAVAPPVRRIIALTAASLALAGAATATAFWLSRRFAVRAFGDPDGQAVGVGLPPDTELPEPIVNGAGKPVMEPDVMPLA